MLKQGTIIPIQSQYASPFVLCGKNVLPPDSPEVYRFGVENRKRNAITKYPRYHLPLIDDLIMNIPHTTIMLALDLRSDYFYLAVNPSDMAKTTFVTKNGNYAFRCESRDNTLKRLNALWTRLIRYPQYLKLYRDFIHEYDQLGHMKEVVAEQDNSEVAYYMPHHDVLRPEKSTTKLRVVFNATNPTSNGLSLNSIQYNGGLAQNDLFTIMIKFREHPYAFTADVKTMYRMILIHESQQPLLRMFWKESPEDPVKAFEMKTVPYGRVSAPFLATRTLLQLSRDKEKNFPLAAPVLRENFYMDDVLCGADSLMEAKALKNQLSGILKKGGIELHKWGSSHLELASNILGDYEFENPIETKTLGVSWKSQDDCFIFKIAVELKDSYTKRCVLSTIARLFDPLRLLGPVVARAKIFMQSLWSLKVSVYLRRNFF
ncbi:uncharacterized protein TNCV_1364261 [Trichonephila clavipes]|uniref:Reverse transcriptase domain-containing protein n=1 Tax=Trichonephila clavipes TaxID=2585209 RepID=A0A8X6RVK7_TRICX|nr:uncharacterized protein TNCV_1364261 [Trichonephila clavipes]